MMGSGDLRSGRDNDRGQEPVAISAGVIILAVTAVVCAGLVAVPLWTALVQGWQAETISDPCGLQDAATRQDCLDELRLGESRHPAKGTNAPIRLHPPGRKSD